MGQKHRYPFLTFEIPYFKSSTNRRELSESTLQTRVVFLDKIFEN
jgi:hypothetical protein